MMSAICGNADMEKWLKGRLEADASGLWPYTIQWPAEEQTVMAIIPGNWATSYEMTNGYQMTLTSYPFPGMVATVFTFCFDGARPDAPPVPTVQNQDDGTSFTVSFQLYA
jgi:hypothetical protein